ncbi:hypothetical protein EAO14_01705 [Klebsiella pneumoniae]|nr:hypothetical protein EAO14_01705 [Klebsiella pneumoniae]
MAFDPPLGSTSPAVLLDNATRLDELVNGPAGTVNDRAGQPLDSWRKIIAALQESSAAAMETIRLTLIPSVNNTPQRLMRRRRLITERSPLVHIFTSGALTTARSLLNTGMFLVQLSLPDAKCRLRIC